MTNVLWFIFVVLLSMVFAQPLWLKHVFALIVDTEAISLLKELKGCRYVSLKSHAETFDLAIRGLRKVEENFAILRPISYSSTSLWERIRAKYRFTSYLENTVLVAMKRVCSALDNREWSLKLLSDMA